MKNPWLNIPASDYEGHMSSPDVAQLSFLSKLFKDSLSKFNTESVAILGCATGNGLEYISPSKTKYIAAVDLNPEYLEILKNRFSDRLNMVDVIQADLNEYNFPKNRFSYIFAGLIFEYIDYKILLHKINKWLKLKGIFTAVLQIENKNNCKISKTQYSSLKHLDSIMNLVEPSDFKKTVFKLNLKEIDSKTVTLNSGKSFFVASYQKI